MSLSLQMMHLSQGEFWLFFSLAVAASAAGFYLTFRWFSRARTIENVPTSRIRSAQQGYVELTGEALLMEGAETTAPLTGSNCCWFHYKIERRGDKNWHTLESDTSDQLFLLRDKTGDCIIDPEGAEVTPSDRSIWYGHSRYPTNRKPMRSIPQLQPLFRLGKLLNTPIGLTGRYRYTEERIYSSDTLYAIGHFKSLDDMDHAVSRNELTRELLREWKQDKAQLLARFDLNGDGQIDTSEWETARNSAKAQAAREQTQQLKNQIIHRLGQGNSRHYPYLLSTLPEFKLVRQYKLKAAGALLLFFVGGAGAVWMFGSSALIS